MAVKRQRTAEHRRILNGEVAVEVAVRAHPVAGFPAVGRIFFLDLHIALGFGGLSEIAIQFRDQFGPFSGLPEIGRSVFDDLDRIVKVRGRGKILIIIRNGIAHFAPRRQSVIQDRIHAANLSPVAAHAAVFRRTLRGKVGLQIADIPDPTGPRLIDRF